MLSDDLADDIRRLSIHSSPKLWVSGIEMCVLFIYRTHQQDEVRRSMRESGKEITE